MQLIKKNQIIAKEGVLNYPQLGRIYKPWDELSKLIGKKVPIKNTHEGNKVGEATIKKCPIGKNILCADIVIDSEEITQIKGFSIGTLSELEKKQGTLGTDSYDYIQRIKELDHIAITDMPRDPNALMDGISSDEFIKEKNNINIILFDSIEYMEDTKMEEKPTEPQISSKIYDDLKTQLSEIAKEKERLTEENKKLREVIDSFEKIERERLISEYRKRLPEYKIEDSYPIGVLKFGLSVLEEYEKYSEKKKNESIKRPEANILKKEIIDSKFDVEDLLAIYRPKGEIK